MAYCTQADLEARATATNVLRWADDNNDDELTSGEVAYITAAISKADTLIDMRLDTRYSVPFSTVPDLIKELSIDLSVWFLASRKGYASGDGGQEGLWKKNFDDAMAILSGLRAGELTIPGVAPRSSILSTEQNVQAVMTYTKQDESGTEIETDLDDNLNQFLAPENFD